MFGYRISSRWRGSSRGGYRSCATAEAAHTRRSSRVTEGACERVSWMLAEPSVTVRERAAMADVAPDLVWREDDPAVGWEGDVPIWPFERSAPPRLEEFLAGARFRVMVVYRQAHPMVSPAIYPIDPEPDFNHRTRHDWHLNGDGSLCLLQGASDWDPRSTAADLVVKASAWFLEYQLMVRGLTASMTEHGIVDDDSLDVYFTGCAE